MAWDDVTPFLEPVANGLECGLLVVDDRDRIVLANDTLATLVGVPQAGIMAMAPLDFVRHVASLVDEAPSLLQELRLLPVDGSPIVCEEFELRRPSRSVVRWVARRIRSPRPGQMVVVTDITPEVDLTAAYERLATTDRLTGLPNRRGAEEVLKREVGRLKRYEASLACALLDIDHFKDVNDRHGHEAGDRVLQQVARAIANVIRDSDYAARWGGEEFLVLMPCTTRAGALLGAERIRVEVQNLVLPGGGKITISAGVAEFRPGETVTDALGRADRNLYEAKRVGRNCVRGG